MIECLDDHKGNCSGITAYRPSLTGTGMAIPRCDKHWGDRLRLEDEINARYPYHQPADFDPYYAGERWSDDS